MISAKNPIERTCWCKRPFGGKKRLSYGRAHLNALPQSLPRVRWSSPVAACARTPGAWGDGARLCQHHC